MANLRAGWGAGLSQRTEAAHVKLLGREDGGWALSGKLLVTRNRGWSVSSVLTCRQVHQQVVANELDDVTSIGHGSVKAEQVGLASKRLEYLVSDGVRVTLEFLAGVTR